jgi:PKD repeat protein
MSVPTWVSLCLLFGLLLPGAASAQLVPNIPVFEDTLYVRKTGSDDCDGSLACPVRTINRAMQIAQSNVGEVQIMTLVLVGPGIYQGPIYYPYNTTVWLRAEQGPDVTFLEGRNHQPTLRMSPDWGEPLYSGVQGFTIRNNDISGDSCFSDCAGAIYASGGSQDQFFILDNHIINNKSRSSGFASSGAIRTDYIQVFIVGNRILDNYSEFGAGAIRCYYGAAVITNNLIEGNDGGYVGGVHVDVGSVLQLAGNTIVQNAAVEGAAGVYIGGGGTQSKSTSDANQFVINVSNNIVANNPSGYGLVADTYIAGDVDLNYNLFYNNGPSGNQHLTSGINPGTGNRIADPLFVAPGTGNYHITCASPALDAGSVSYLPGDVLTRDHDFDGPPQDRVGPTGLDIGADEFYDFTRTAEFTASPTIGCAPLVVHFNNLSDYCIDEGWYWDFGDDNISSLKNPVHTYTVPGTYTVELTAEGIFAEDTKTRTNYITVLAPCTAQFEASVTEGCEPLTVTFTASAQPAITEYRWTFGEEVVVTSDPVITHTFDSSGTFDVALEASNVCCTATVYEEEYVTVLPSPDVSFTADTTRACGSLDVKFTAVEEGGESDLEWIFGDGATASGNPVMHTYDEPGVYDVELRAASDPCTTSVVIEDYITIDPIPTAAFDASPKSGLAPLTVTFTAVDDGVATNFEWNFGDDNTGSGRVTQHTYTTPGQYDIYLDASSDRCEWAASKANLIDVQGTATPEVAIEADTLSGCDSLTVTFEAVSECVIESAEWQFGDGGAASGNPVKHTYDSAGTYDVGVSVVTDCGDDDTLETELIRVDQPIDASFTADGATEGCDSLTVQFTATANAEVDEFLWRFSDGTTADGNPASHTFTGAGAYDVTLEATNLCGTDTVTSEGFVVINESPDVTISSDYDPEAGACTPDTVTFEADPISALISWTWNFGDGGTSKAASPTHIFTTAGAYTVTLDGETDCGEVTYTYDVEIVVSGRPMLDSIVVSQTDCDPSAPVSLAAYFTPDPDSSRWFFGDDTDALGPEAEHTYPIGGDYDAFIVVFHECGEDTFSHEVHITGTPVAEFTAVPRQTYEPATINFTDHSTNSPDTWLWDFGDGGDSPVQDPTHQYAAGEYTVTLTVSNDCGEDTETKSNYVSIGGFAVSVDSSGTDGDAILYDVMVAALVRPYDNSVNLSAELLPDPARGSLQFTFDDLSGTPPFSTTLRAVPTGGLSPGDYTIEVTADDPARTHKTGSETLHFIGSRLLSITPVPVEMDDTPVGEMTTTVVTISNDADPGSDATLEILDLIISGTPFAIVDGAPGVLEPQESLPVTLSFTPDEVESYEGILQILSDDPFSPDTSVAVLGDGIPEQVPPRVESTQPDTDEEIEIDDTVWVMFNEPMLPPVVTQTLLTLTSGKTGTTITGTETWLDDQTLEFVPGEFFPADDTITVVVSAIVTDLAGNALDGNGDGTGGDDYTFQFTTGPGVWPGDTDADGFVNESDILPIGRFWETHGPPRTNPRDGFVIQAATAWTPRNATHADADGNGVVDSMDICPIADYFDFETGLSRPFVESWMDEAQSWPATVVQALTRALDACSGETAGSRILKRFLNGLKSADALPDDYKLLQNYPNPFNPVTVIEYTLPSRAHVRLEIFDITGRMVRVLEDGSRAEGMHHVIWDGRDANDQPLASGVYFYRLTAPEYRLTRKMVLLR